MNEEKWWWSVVETDNLDEYPNESFTIRRVRKAAAEKIASVINDEFGEMYGRFWKVVEDSIDKPYKLQPGFEP